MRYEYFARAGTSLLVVTALISLKMRAFAFVPTSLKQVHKVSVQRHFASVATDAEQATEYKYDFNMDDVVSLCKRRGIIFPSSEIYNGYAGFYDYGPLGAELKKNVKDAWWKFFVTRREDVVGLDSSIIHNPTTWKSSGTYFLRSNLI
jgi:hypothetical protein